MESVLESDDGPRALARRDIGRSYLRLLKAILLLSFSVLGGWRPITPPTPPPLSPFHRSTIVVNDWLMNRGAVSDMPKQKQLLKLNKKKEKAIPIVCPDIHIVTLSAQGRMLG